MTKFDFLQWSSAAFAFLAGALWLWSALVSIPKAIQHIDLGDFAEDGPKEEDDLDRLMHGLRRQSRLSALAAIAAAIAALLQGAALLPG